MGIWLYCYAEHSLIIHEPGTG